MPSMNYRNFRLYPNPADFRHKIQIQKPLNAQNELGEVIEDPDSAGWMTVSTPMAAIEPMSAAQFWAAGRYEHELDTLIRLWYMPSLHLDDTMQVIWEGRTFHIHGIVDVEEKHIQLCLICREVK
jgi:SPP1 family predicted phage head-tail adaptor